MNINQKEDSTWLTLSFSAPGTGGMPATYGNCALHLIAVHPHYGGQRGGLLQFVPSPRGRSRLADGVTLNYPSHPTPPGA